MGARAGTRATVEIEGDFLDRAAAIRCECDDVSAAIRKVASVRLEADFEVSAGATPGPRVVYLETARGTSNRFLFRVTKWNSVVEREPNDAPSEALPLELPVSVEGRISRLTDVDFYRFHAAAGERLAFNVIASRNKAAGYVSVTLLSKVGRELAHNNSQIGPDAYLDYTFAEDSDYLVVVTPRRFADFFTVVKDDQLINWQYELAIGRSPILRSIFPMGGKRGTTFDAELHADFLPPRPQVQFSGKGVSVTNSVSGDEPCGCHYKLRIEIAKDAETGVHYLTAPDESGNSTALGFAVGELAELTSGTGSPSVLELPVTVNGRLASADERGAFRFKANQDDETTFEVEARSLGSQMTDPQLLLMRAGGETVDAADDRCRKCSGFHTSVGKKAMLDPKLTHAFISASANDADAAGEYDVILLDNSSRRGEDETYRLTIRKKRPHFEIGVATDHVNAVFGATARIPVVIAREEGFDEDIQVSVRRLPRGWTARPLTIGPGRDKGDLEIDRENASSAAGTVEVYGNSQLAAVPPLIGEDGPGFLEPARTSVQVGFVEAPLFSLSIEEPFSGFVIDRKGATRVEIPVAVERAAGFAALLQFALEAAPRGLTVSAQDEGHIWIEADPNVAQAGRHRMAVRATAEVQGKQTVEISGGFRLQVK